MDPKRICNVIEEHENRRHKTNQPSIQRGAIHNDKKLQIDLKVLLKSCKINYF